MECPEDLAQKADHFKTNDETIVPGHLNSVDKKDIRRGLGEAVEKSKSKMPWMAFLMASILGKRVLQMRRGMQV